MEKTKMTLSQRDVRNIITVLEWGLSDYDDEKHSAELYKLLERFEKARERMYE